MQETIDGAMSKHFEDSGDRPALQPNIEMQNGEKWKEGDDVEVSMTYEALPSIPDVDFSKIKLQKLVVKSDKAAVDEALDNLASSANDFKDRKKGSKAKDGDQVVIDFLGTVAGEAFEGGSSEDYPLVLGSNSFIPGFEEQLIGCKAGDDKNVKVTFPDDYGSKDLAGKNAEFACKVKNVKEPVPAKINDELATKFGAEFTMKLSWFFTICGVFILLFSGYFEIFPWNYELFIWTGWLLVLEILVHYIYLPISPQPTYNTVAKGSIILATFEAAATLMFLIIFLR